MAKVKEVTKEEEDWVKDNLQYDAQTGHLWWTKQGFRRNLDRPADSLDKSVGYTRVVRRYKGFFRNYKAHRLAWFLYYGVWPKDYIDHVNGIKSDNRLINLREATGFQNQANRKPQVGCSSKYKGVSWFKQTCKWEAYIEVNRKKIHLGHYHKEEEAALAYNRAALEHFGEYAKINDLTP